jgi:DNA invertase Pin-like site-specific DNA recombinase
LHRLVKSLGRAVEKLDMAREERDDLIVRAAKEGMSVRQIARATGLSSARVQQIIKPQAKRKPS